MDEPSPDHNAGTPSKSGNLPEYSVSEISGAIKRTLEGNFSRVRVRGEITEFKRYASGHLYFSLKDEGGKMSGVVWRGSVSRLGLVPENGLEIIATGKISSYGERSSYQLIVERMEYAGEGALLARIERLRLKLAEEGLFDPERKRTIPLLPLVVGVVSSPQGAVLHDIQTTIARRFGRPILLWPVAVQGEGAAAQITAAIQGFDRIEPGGSVPRPDVLIVARGGGSLEDLMAFNNEAVLRAVAACTIPLISAVGHETDTTLIDFVSDRRAPTPTAAAEMAVPVRAELLADLAHRGARLVNALARLNQTARLRLDRASAGLPDLPNLLGMAGMKLDDRVHRLERALPGLVERRRTALLTAERHMPQPEAVIARHAAVLARFSTMLDGAMRDRLHGARRAEGRLRLSPAPLTALCRERAARLAGLGGQLEAISPNAVLARGYALVRDAAGNPVTQAAKLKTGAQIRVVFADGEKRARVEADQDVRQAALEF